MSSALATIASSADRKLVQLWLHDQSAETQRAYLNDVVLFLGWYGGTIADLRLEDLQRYRDHLEQLEFASGTVRRRLGAVKSLLSFGQKIGALRLNVGAALRLPAPHPAIGELAERILSEADVLRLIERVDRPRDRALCRIIYAAALRASEAAGLRKRDVIGHARGGVISVWGKGSRPRVIRVSPATYAELVRVIPPDAGASDSVFGLSARQIGRIVKSAARGANLSEDVSPHWLRHAHASHALDRGAPIHLVQQTLGHRSVQTTGNYLHARPNDSSALYLPV